ncbi:DUF4350 domain-containing protein [Mucilaginibacter sp. RB4R14]|uniref:DUF4350 domain-containing protein n=1 Tax=Mucilaginibacter aurantiaciroseus TaxID=2949308 RepID=UPI0020914FB5|nr:DUF4350 domain-containing protein [Mucilaginibacter aurantiaciroseus]MCO5937349.1 DUF4350 domain-containing protein [Mucilaginibacter aurantiaciroseus]
MKGYKVYLAAISVLLILYFVAEYNRPKSIDWESSLKRSDKIPYGTYVLYKQLSDIYPKANVINTNKSLYQVLTSNDSLGGNYLIVTNSTNIGKDDFKALTKFISKGNSAFISSDSWNNYLADTLKIISANEFVNGKIGLNFTNPALKQLTDYKLDNTVASRYFSSFDTLRASIISKNQFGKSVFLRYKYGKGSLFMFAAPKVFTNYNLLKPAGTEYAAKVLSYLPVANNVYWDQHQNNELDLDESSLRVFFSHPPLRWAFYLSLGGMVLFLLYEIKRRQRIIPVIDPLKNSTVEFVSVVGKVYYEQRNNADIAFKKITYFTGRLRNTYNLKTGIYDDAFLNALINKTGVETLLAQDLIGHINYLLPQKNITDHELITLNQLIEKFYIQTGSYGK